MNAKVSTPKYDGRRMYSQVKQELVDSWDNSGVEGPKFIDWVWYTPSGEEI